MTFADLEYELTEGALIASVSGEIDMSNARAIVQGVSRATPNAVAGVILDLTGVHYLDSAGIHMIFRLRAGLNVRGQRLAVVIASSSPVHDALQLAGVQGLIEVEETREAAVSAVRSSEKDPAST